VLDCVGKHGGGAAWADGLAKSASTKPQSEMPVTIPDFKPPGGRKDKRSEDCPSEGKPKHETTHCNNGEGDRPDQVRLHGAGSRALPKTPKPSG
jgi:hypothetical protein